MSLTRKFLRELIPEITKEAEDAIIGEHTAVVNPLKNDSDTLRVVQQELDDLKKDDWKTKYETEHTAYEQYKTQTEAKATKAAKETAVKAYLKNKGVSDDNLDIAMLATATLIDGVEIENDAIKNGSKLDELLAGTLKPLLAKTDSDKPAPAKDKSTSTVSTGGGLGGGSSKAEPKTLADALRERSQGTK